MWRNRGQGRPAEDVHADYADPLASILVECLDRSSWTETVRFAVSADEATSWLNRQSDVHLDGSSDYVAEWRSGTTRFRFQLLEVPPLDRTNATAWNISRRWRKQPHMLLVACLIAAESGDTRGIHAVDRVIRRMVADLAGELQIVSNYDAGKHALKRELKVARAVPLLGTGPSPSARSPRPAD